MEIEEGSIYSLGLDLFCNAAFIRKPASFLFQNCRYSLDPTSKFSKAKFLHYRVMERKEEDKKLEFYLRQGHVFDSLLELIAHYKVGNNRK